MRLCSGPPADKPTHGPVAVKYISQAAAYGRSVFFFFFESLLRQHHLFVPRYGRGGCLQRWWRLYSFGLFGSVAFPFVSQRPPTDSHLHSKKPLIHPTQSDGELRCSTRLTVKKPRPRKYCTTLQQTLGKGIPESCSHEHDYKRSSIGCLRAS